VGSVCRRYGFASSSLASEISVGLKPTILEFPDGTEGTVSHTHHFFVDDVHPTSEVVASTREFDRRRAPPAHSAPDGVVTFVADEVVQ